MKKLALITLTAAALSACQSLPVYEKGYSGSATKPILHQAKQSTSAHYLGTTLVQAVPSHEQESNYLADLDYQYNITFDKASVSFLTGAYSGAHGIEEVKESKGQTLNYWGVNSQLKLSSFAQFGGFRIGASSFVGLDYEFGPYAQWLEAARELELVAVAQSQDTSFGIGVFSEIISSKGHVFSVQSSIAYPGTISISSHLQGNSYVVGLGVMPHLKSDDLGYFATYKWRLN